FGAHLEYLVSITQPVPTVVGGLQFSSAAWRIEVRDQWIGWDEATRAHHLPQVVNNSRFLLLPWIHIKNLASATLARVLRRLPADWQAQYGVTPLLVETFVDAAHYTGACYRAANWVELGETSGRGRDDRQHRRHGALAAVERQAVDDCADYLINYAPYLQYDKVLAEGIPMATGVIEGTCRHLVEDRMNLTGARWSLTGAEAVLRLRALRSSDDFDA